MLDLISSLFPGADRTTHLKMPCLTILSLAMLVVYSLFSDAAKLDSSAQQPSGGCGKFAQPPHDFPVDHKMNSSAGGGERHFRLYLPPDASPSSLPSLILSFHGKGQNASAMEFETQLSNPDFNPHAIVAYPQGISKQWTGDPESPLRKEVDDIEFANDLLDHLEAKLCFDKSRVYASGFSNGGGLTFLLACDSTVSSRLAAVAIASGAVYEDDALKEPLFSQCSPSYSPLPLMEFHGDKDPVIHYDGVTTPDGPSYSLPEWLQSWAVRNGCTADDEGTINMLYDDNVEKVTWSCNGKDDVVTHYYIHGFGHGWPSTTSLENDYQRFGPTYFNATPVIMEFFGKHTLPPNTAAATARDEL